MAEGRSEGEATPEDAKRKGGAKRLIIKIVPLVLIALVAVKMTVLKAPPPTPAQVAAKVAETKRALQTKCALANNMQATATTTPADTTPNLTTTGGTMGPVLELDSKTMNLEGSHFLKVGISLQLPTAAIPDDIKTQENWSSVASQLVIDTFTGRSLTELAKDGLRERLQHQIGNEVCLKTDGKVVTVYFIDFVMQ